MSGYLKRYWLFCLVMGCSIWYIYPESGNPGLIWCLTSFMLAPAIDNILKGRKWNA